MHQPALAAMLMFLAASACAEATPPEPQALYAEHCASCHGARRYGGYAPPLIPVTLGRKPDEALAAAILEGLPNTQMRAYGDTLSSEQATALVALLREPTAEITWTAADMAASREEFAVAERKIPSETRRENLTLVVERGSGSVVILDGDSLEELDRFPVGKIHGGLKFDRALRRVLASTRDGVVVDYDLERGGLRARVVAGVNTRNIAISPDGDFVAAANQLPPGLVIFDAELRPLAVFPLDGQPSGVYYVPGEERFVVTARDTPLLSSVSTGDLVLSQVQLPEPFEDFIFVPGSSRLVASSRGGNRLTLYDYAENQVIATLPTQGLPHLFSACFFEREGKLHAAFNHMGDPKLTIIEMEDFRIVKEIPLVGSGFFARTHPGTPYVWVDTNTETIQLVEKASLATAERSLTPEPGKQAMHVEFTADGKTAFVSVWDPQGAVVVYDAVSLEEMARLPFSMPVGKYNAGNKTRELR
ncbi:MAG: c-type cytochrome [Deltaproteobacteria bacterium]|nr:c-type cytochrome [Deltaproteobacteria bacterium]